VGQQQHPAAMGHKDDSNKISYKKGVNKFTASPEPLRYSAQLAGHQTTIAPPHTHVRHWLATVHWLANRPGLHRLRLVTIHKHRRNTTTTTTSGKLGQGRAWPPFHQGKYSITSDFHCLQWNRPGRAGGCSASLLMNFQVEQHHTTYAYDQSRPSHCLTFTRRSAIPNFKSQALSRHQLTFRK
jgi:hypothetical protein